MKKNEETEKNTIDIAVLQNEMREVKEDVKSVLNNHLPHIQDSIVELKLQIARWGGAIAILIIILGAMPWILKLFHII